MDVTDNFFGLIPYFLLSTNSMISAISVKSVQEENTNYIGFIVAMYLNVLCILLLHQKFGDITGILCS